MLTQIDNRLSPDAKTPRRVPDIPVAVPGEISHYCGRINPQLIMHPSSWASCRVGRAIAALPFAPAPCRFSSDLKKNQKRMDNVSNVTQIHAFDSHPKAKRTKITTHQPHACTISSQTRCPASHQWLARRNTRPQIRLYSSPCWQLFEPTDTPPHHSVARHLHSR